MQKFLFPLIIFIFIVCNKVAVADPVIEIPDNEFNFGEVLPGQILHHIFEVKNVGTSDLIIADVTPGCGCTTALLVDKVIPPGKSVKILADLTAQSIDGVMRKSISVGSNDTKNSAFIIYLNATVKSDFLVEPRQIDIGDIFIGGKKDFTFTLKPINKKAFDPSQIIYSKEIFKVEYKPLDDKNPLSAIEFKVEYFAAAKFLARQAYDMIKIYPYKDNTTLSVDVAFKGNVKGYIKQSASSIYRSVEKDKGHTETINFKHLKDVPFVIISAVSNNPKITSNIVKVSESEYNVEVMLKDPMDTKKEDVMVTVTTDQEDSKTMRIYMTLIQKR